MRDHLHQRLADLSFVPETHWQVVAVAAPLARPLAEVAGDNGTADEVDLGQVLGKVRRLRRTES